MEIASKNLTVQLLTTVNLTGYAVVVCQYAGPNDLEGAQTIVSLDSLLQEFLDMHEFWRGGGYAPELLEELLQIRKLVDSYIRKVRANPKGSAASRTRGSRPCVRGK